MNIFKVLASRKKFPEEMTSVLLGWLMHPKSEHGMGRLFLERLVKAVAGANNDIPRQLGATPDDKIKCSLEENVSTALIDVVYFFGDYVFAIENKIYDGSIEEKQLQREYYGLRRKYPDKKIIMTYLVPDESPMASIEYNGLLSILEKSHMSALITWADTICDIISDILPFAPAHTKPILQSLNEFVKGEFYGYDFIYKGGRGGTHSNFPRSTYAELKRKTQGFVGVALGAAGLMKMSKEELLRKGFQYDESLECNRQYWLPLKEFISLAEHRINGEGLPKGFKQRLDSASIYKMTCQPNKIYVGIQGGERGMLAIGRHEISVKSWQVTTGEQPNSQWIPGARYKQIYEQKFGNEIDAEIAKAAPIKTLNRGDSSEGRLGRIHSAQIYEMVSQPNCGKMFIGIKSGERALAAMERQEIENKSWQVTTGEQPNSQWIPGARFKQIYESKFPERKAS